jgi:hypothetical protein
VKSVLNARIAVMTSLYAVGEKSRAYKTSKTPPVITAASHSKDDLTDRLLSMLRDDQGYAREAFQIIPEFFFNPAGVLLLMPAFKPPKTKTPPDGRVSMFKRCVAK